MQVETEFFNCGTEPVMVQNSLAGETVIEDRIEMMQVTKESPRPLGPGERHRPAFVVPQVQRSGWYRVRTKPPGPALEAGPVLAAP
jgi:hypothetical protein